mmetsp:Transcript_21651/g.40740  ORF Transcript_21651/g.40740 Transcript_21651/m.40740 type:complete len:303 (+) Transcript_21651:568-1476(+)
MLADPVLASSSLMLNTNVRHTLRAWAFSLNTRPPMSFFMNFLKKSRCPTYSHQVIMHIATCRCFIFAANLAKTSFSCLACFTKLTQACRVLAKAPWTSFWMVLSPAFLFSSAAARLAISIFLSASEAYFSSSSACSFSCASTSAPTQTLHPSHSALFPSLLNTLNAKYFRRFLKNKYSSQLLKDAIIFWFCILLPNLCSVTLLRFSSDTNSCQLLNTLVMRPFCILIATFLITNRFLFSPLISSLQASKHFATQAWVIFLKKRTIFSFSSFALFVYVFQPCIVKLKLLFFHCWMNLCIDFFA